jgi:lantibiotic biosynthesis protein
VATGRSEFLTAAKGALAYERALLKPAQGNWPDLRGFVQPTATGEPPCMLAWCHGAPGIGIARAALHSLLPDEHAIVEELEIAIRTTAATLGETASGAGNFSLCHGEGGNAELLLLAAEVLDRPELRHTVEDAGTAVLERFGEGRLPWPCGIPSAGETPNLMLGLAGIGYFFLRLHDPQHIPTVLLPGASGYRREPRG